MRQDCFSVCEPAISINSETIVDITLPGLAGERWETRYRLSRLSHGCSSITWMNAMLRRL